jgi:EAL domain-containing protein (putative c-di-GMP-specific phosphodiesterase class I)
MDVVAEGVETDSQFAKLKGMMCDEVQGFLLGKPVTAEELGTLLHQQVNRNLIQFKARKAIA